MNKILVVCPIGIGNFIMLTPALQRLVSSCKYDLEILCLKPAIAEMARASQWFSTVHFWDPDQQGKWKALFVLKKMRQNYYTFVLRFFPTNHWKYSLFCFFLKKEKQIHFVYKSKKILTNRLLYQFGLHDVEQNHRLVDLVLKQPNSSWIPLQFFCDKKETQIKFSSGLPLIPYVVCHMGCSVHRGMIQKRLPIEKWIEIIDHLYQEYGLIFIPIGGTEEEPIKKLLHKKCKKGQVLLRPTQSLDDLKTLIEQSLFFIGNDSGLMHISVALHKNVIAFFGPSDENRVAPYYLNQTNWENQKRQEHLVLRNRSIDLNYDKNNLKLLYPKDGGLLNLSCQWALNEIKHFLNVHFPNLKK